MNKAFSQITIKSVDEDAGIIRGIATTPSTDRAGDIVEPMGAEFSLPLPLLNGHDAKDPVGEVFEAKATPAGIEFSARIAKDVSDAIGEVWRRTKAGLFKHVSIGFRAIEFEPIATGYRFKKWAWLELSLTPTPANPEAGILAVKSANTKEQHMTVSEQVAGFLAKRAELIGKMDTLVLKGATLQGQDDVDFKQHEAELAEVDKHLDRLKAIEARQAAAAVSVQGVKSIEVTDNAPKGTDFVRFVKATALSRGNPMQALEIAKSMNYGPRVENVLKAAVSAGTTTSAGFTSLIDPAVMAGEFIDLLRPQTIIGKMSKVRNVPGNIKLLKANTGTSASWIGEGKPAPITNAAFGDLTIGDHKIGAISVFSEELLRRAEPAADALVRDDLTAAIVTAIDVAFIDQANAGVVGVKPASIVNAATTAATAGVTAAHARTDVKLAKKNAIAANQPLDTACWVMHPATALALESMVNSTTSVREFPLINSVSGGFFEGLPVVISTSVPGTDALGYDVILAVQGEILLAEGGLAVDASREASLEMDSAPTNDSATPTAASLVSLWQTGSVAIKAIRGITWTRRRPTAVYRISACKYA